MDCEEDDGEEKSSINFTKIKTLNSNLLLFILTFKSEYVNINFNSALRRLLRKYYCSYGGI
jgi:hypothetical protein